MPIKDLSDDVRLPRLGKIKLGIKVKHDKGVEYPQKTDYFVFDKEHSAYRQLVELYGEQPKELPILIPVEDEEVWASQYYKSYNKTYGLVCKGDGESALRMVNNQTNEIPKADESCTVKMIEVDCPGRDCPIYQNKQKGKPQCHEVMNLRFILPEVPGLGVWQIDTGSKNSILNINSCAKLIKRAFGRLSMIPLKLTFEPMQVNNPETGKKQTVYVLNLRTDVTIQQLADVAREQIKFLSAGSLEDAYDIEVEKDFALYDDNPPNIMSHMVTTPEIETPENNPPPDAPQSKSSEPEQEKQGNDSEELNYNQIAGFVKTKEQLKRACKKYFNLDEHGILVELGIKSWEENADPYSKCFLTIAGVR